MSFSRPQLDHLQALVDALPRCPVQVGVDAQVLTGGELVEVVLDVRDVPEPGLDGGELAGHVVPEQGGLARW